MKTIYTSLLLLTVGLLISCSVKKGTQKAPSSDLMQLKAMMTGSFNSSAQAAADTSYYDITLHMYPIWEDRPEHWLYVEQTVTTMPDRPYRQRVYRLEQTDKKTFKSYVYTFADPKPFIGAWKDKTPFEKMQPAEAQLKEGCEVVLIKQADGSFRGKTGDKTCKSSLRGASFATSEVSVSPGKIVSWDQGWDAAGEQVWGATEAGYVFLKTSKNGGR